MTARIELDELPARLRMLADDAKAIGDAAAHFGGFGAFGEWGCYLGGPHAEMCREIAAQLERMQGGRA